MRKLFSILLASVLAHAANAQDVITGQFNTIRISGSAKVYVSQGAQSTITITGQQNLAGISVSDEKLNISRVFNEPVHVVTPSLTNIDISGNGDIIMDSVFTIDNLEIKVSGNGKSDMNLKGGSVIMNVSGNFSGSMKGTADLLEVNASGRANVFATDLTVNNCKLNISGLSKVLIDVKDTLQTNISGKGTVITKSDPAHIDARNSGLASLGNTNSTVNDTTKLNFGKTTVLVVNPGKQITWNNYDTPRKSQFHWAGVEFGFNNYLNSDNKLDAPDGYNYLELNSGKAVFVNINPFEYKFKLYERYIMLGTGFGFSFRNYYFANEDSILVSGAETVTAMPAAKSYNKYKLAVDYITVPLLLEFNTSKYNKNSFHFGGGMVFNYKIGSRVKLKSGEGKEKIHNEFNLRPVELDARVHIGFGELNLFATYSLEGLFKENKGPELRPVTIGITLAGW